MGCAALLLLGIVLYCIDQLGSGHPDLQAVAFSAFCGACLVVAIVGRIRRLMAEGRRRQAYMAQYEQGK